MTEFEKIEKEEKDSFSYNYKTNKPKDNKG